MKNKITILLLILTCLSSCKKSYESLIDEKIELGYSIINYDPDGFYYADSNGFYYYDRNTEEETTIYKEGLTELKFYCLELTLSNDGIISAQKNGVDDSYYFKNQKQEIAEFKESFLNNLVHKGALPFDNDGLLILYRKGHRRVNSTWDATEAASDEVEAVVEEVVEYSDDVEKIVDKGSRKYDVHDRYLINPIDSTCLEVIILDPYDVNNAFSITPNYIGFKMPFSLSQLPNNLMPQITDIYLREALFAKEVDGYQNQLGRFNYQVLIDGTGEIVQPEEIKSIELDLRIPRIKFTNPKYMTSFLESKSSYIIKAYNRKKYKIAESKAKTPRFFYEYSRNVNEIERMVGKTFYVKAVIERVSSQNSDGSYKIIIDTDVPKLEMFCWTHDDRFAYLHLPAKVIFKGTLSKFNPTNMFSWSDVVWFKDVELIGESDY